jgi:hypothetical protein
MRLILRKMRAQARIDGLRTDIWIEDDYAVVDGETCFGRIYPETTTANRSGGGSCRPCQHRCRTAG